MVRVRQGYRLVEAPADRGRLVAMLASRFVDREARDVSRVRQVLDYARDPSCLTRRLLAYFGEDFTAPCGHCARCLGHPTAVLWVLRDNPRALAFYEKAGWHFTGEEKMFTPWDPPDSPLPRISYVVRQYEIRL